MREAEMPIDAFSDTAALRANQEGALPGLLGFDWTMLRTGAAAGRFDVKKHHLAPTGFLHAATVVALADTACGFGCLKSLPQQAAGFTTAELKANFIGTAREGGVKCEARQFCRVWPNQQTVTIKGSHFLQEEAPDEVGDATARFVSKVLAGQFR
jgi:1,4-dihydroxy-2-naphthoyl-CoA hydrolase